MKATKKLIGASVALVAALAVSVGSTFAWFTMSNTAKVNQFEINVKDETGALLIGTDAGSVSNLPLDVSENAGVKDKKLDAYTSSGTNKSDFALKTESSGSSVDSAYVKFTLYFEATTELSVYLTNKSEIKPGTDNTTPITLPASVATPIASEYGTEIVSNKLSTRAAYATRVAFVTEDSAKIWAPNEATGDSNPNSTGKGFWKGNLAEDYKSYYEGTEWPTVKSTNTTYTANQVTTLVGNEANGQSGKEICKLTMESDSKYTGQVDIWIWLEGKDGDCLNSIYKDSLLINFNFVGLTEAV